MFFGENGEPMLRSTLGIADEDCVAISVGSLVENKGHRVLIDALRILVPLHPRLILLIAGDGPLRRELEEYVRRSQLSVHVDLWEL